MGMTIKIGSEVVAGALFLPVLVVSAIVPSRALPSVTIAGVPVKADLLLLTAGGILALLVLATSGRLHQSVRRPVVVFSMCLPAYSILRVDYAGAGPRAIVAGLGTIVFAWAGQMLALHLVAARPRVHVRRTLNSLSWIIVAIAAVYSLESFVNLGLRSEHRLSESFAIERVKGPLFGSAIGALVLVPALAYFIGQALEERRLVGSSGLAISLLTVAIFGLGSRAAIISLLVLLILLAARPSGLRRRIGLLLGASVIILATGAVVFSQAGYSRIISLEDSARSTTYMTSLRMYLSLPVELKLLGAGYYTVWPWYLEQARVETFANMYPTAYGWTLFHPHSTFLLALVELGLLGLLLLVGSLLPLFFVLKSLRRSSALTYCCAAGVVASVVVFATDLVIFNNWVPSAVWWVYYFSVIDGHKDRIDGLEMARAT